MSVTHTIVPFEEKNRAELENWLDNPIPTNVIQGRFPTMTELKTTLVFLQKSMDFRIEYLEGSYTWEAKIYVDDTYNSIEATMGIDKKASSERIKFGFRGDRSVLVTLLQNLPSDCGTFLILINGEDPEFVISSRNK